MPSDFTDPARLLLLGVVAALAVGQLVLQLARRRTERAWTDPALRASTLPRRPGRLRHVGTALLLASLVAMTTAFAGPRQEVEVPRERATVVLTLDVSSSMLAEDVAPNRFDAAKRAATGFVQALPDGFDIALVTFAGTSSVVVPATQDAARVTDAIEQLSLTGGTALGDALLTSVGAAAWPSEVPAAVVMLADGGSTVGAPVEQGIEAAVQAEIPVTTIAYGTAEGVVVADGKRFEVPVDEPVLARIADATGGRAYTAATADELTQVYDSIRGRLSTTVEEQEVSSRFAGLGLLLLLGAAVPSLLRPRLG